MIARHINLHEDALGPEPLDSVAGVYYTVTRKPFGRTQPFTRSNGTIIARLYERLTKASRRRDPGPGKLLGPVEEAYRQGVYDAYKAIQEELSQ